MSKELRQKIWELYCRGAYIGEIAKAFNISEYDVVKAIRFYDNWQPY